MGVGVGLGVGGAVGFGVVVGVGWEVEIGVGVALGAAVPTGVGVGEDVETVAIGEFEEPPPPHATSAIIILAEIKGNNFFNIGSSFLRMKICTRAFVRYPVNTARLK